jgi:hypothetical protein
VRSKARLYAPIGQALEKIPKSFGQSGRWSVFEQGFRIEINVEPRGTRIQSISRLDPVWHPILEGSSWSLSRSLSNQGWFLDRVSARFHRIFSSEPKITCPNEITAMCFYFVFYYM